MASERFLHLPEEKRQRIIAAAREELSRVPYDEVSINRIIREAGIPRGSFYDYFDDKDDMIEYLMGDYCHMMENTIRAMFGRSPLNIFEAAYQVVASTVSFGMEEGRSALCRNLFSCMRMNRRFSFETTYRMNFRCKQSAAQLRGRHSGNPSGSCAAVSFTW